MNANTNGCSEKNAFFVVQLLMWYWSCLKVQLLIKPSNKHHDPQTVYRRHERIKKRAYEQRIREVEHATFSPFSTFCYRWFSQGGHNFLQEISFLACHQMGRIIYHCIVLVAMPSIIFTSMILNSSHQRSQIIMWTCHQNPQSVWPSNFRVSFVMNNYSLLRCI